MLVKKLSQFLHFLWIAYEPLTIMSSPMTMGLLHLQQKTTPLL